MKVIISTSMDESNKKRTDEECEGEFLFEMVRNF